MRTLLVALSFVAACADKAQTDSPVDSPADSPADSPVDTGPFDADTDGVAAAEDCDDTDAAIGAAGTWYTDADGDGYGDDTTAVSACEAPAAAIAQGQDCNDENKAVNPGAAEACDGLDTNCDGSVSKLENDFSGDGYLECEPRTTCNNNGMTWKQSAYVPADSVVTVTCYAEGHTCDPYSGDTACTEALPLICVKEGTHENPASYVNWTGADIAITDPISGCQLSTPIGAANVCEGWFGEGWRVGEWHDAGSNGFSGIGSFDTTSKLWVEINDQGAECWDSGV